MSWPSLIPLALGFLALRRGLLITGGFLGARALCDLARSVLTSLRAGFTKPYHGLEFLAWLVSDVAIFLLPPAALLHCFGYKRNAVVFWALTVGIVAVSYPALRGDELVLHYYSTVYLTAYLNVLLLVLLTSLARMKMTRDDAALLFTITAGVASVLLVRKHGTDAWWAVWITNGAGYAGVAYIAATSSRSR